MKKVYLVLCVLGIVLPYYHLIHFLIENNGSMEGVFYTAFCDASYGDDFNGYYRCS